MAKAVLDLEGLEAGNVTLLAGSAVDLLWPRLCWICKGLGAGGRGERDGFVMTKALLDLEGLGFRT